MGIFQQIRLFLVPLKAREYSDLFFSGKLQLKMYNGESYADALTKAIEIYLPESVRKDRKELKTIVTDAIKSNLLFGFKPHEFFMYDLADKKVKEWAEYLAERDRVGTLHREFGLLDVSIIY